MFIDLVKSCCGLSSAGLKRRTAPLNCAFIYMQAVTWELLFDGLTSLREVWGGWTPPLDIHRRRPGSPHEV